MIITYHGAQCFKISQGDLTLAFNPISKDSKLGPTRFGADITLITTNINDLNGRDETSRGDKKSFVIFGPGEYEVKNVFVKGFLSSGPQERLNTIYLVTFEGMKLCFLGALSNAELGTETLEAIEDVDLLFTPLGENGTLGPQAAYKLAVSLEPKVIIPMYYDKAQLGQFIKEGGEAKTDPIDKFVVKKKDLEGREGEIVVLKEE